MDLIYIYTREYISTLKKKKNADPNNSIAEIDIRLLDDRKGKYIACINFFDNNIAKLNLNCKAKEEINKIIIRIAYSKATKIASSVFTISMINNVLRNRWDLLCKKLQTYF